jgi:hypothetical protein
MPVLNLRDVLNLVSCVGHLVFLHRVTLNLIDPIYHKVRTYKEYHSVCPSSELGLPPTPHPQASVPPHVSGGRATLAGEKGVGRVPIPTRGIHCGTLYMYILCAIYALRKCAYNTILQIAIVYNTFLLYSMDI